MTDNMLNMKFVYRKCTTHGTSVSRYIQITAVFKNRNQHLNKLIKADLKINSTFGK